MRPALGEVEERAFVRPGWEARMPTAAAPTPKEIPFDYVAKFTLKGIGGNRVQEVINISTEGAFVAVSIAYSFIPAPLPKREAELGTLSNVVQKLGWPAVGAGTLYNDIFSDPRHLLRCLFIRFCGIDFKYSIIDSGSGRELQNLPIHSLAGLGRGDGDRPFRPFAKPMLFLPRSTVRIDVEEISEGTFYRGAELYIVLHGYKILGYGTTP